MSQLSKEYTSAFFNSKPRQTNTKLFCEGLVSITSRNPCKKNNFLSKYDIMLRELSSSSITNTKQRVLSPVSILTDYEPLSKLTELKRELSNGKNHSKELKDLLFQRPQPVNLNLNSLLMNVSLKSKKTKISSNKPTTITTAPRKVSLYLHTHSNSINCIENSYRAKETNCHNNNNQSIKYCNTQVNCDNSHKGSFAFGNNKDSSQLYTMKTMMIMNDFYDEIPTMPNTNSNHNNIARINNTKIKTTIKPYKKKIKKVIDYETKMKINNMKSSISNDLRSFSSRNHKV